MSENQTQSHLLCPKCGVSPGERHDNLCTLEQCPRCGLFFQFCECAVFPGDDFLPWTGELPGSEECRARGWFAKPAKYKSTWIPCDPDDPAAMPDLERLIRIAPWNSLLKRFVRYTTGVNPSDHELPEEKEMNTMARNTIKIWYAHDETGPAELIGDRLARIVHPPLLADNIFPNDIVRLSHNPEDDDDGHPRIVEVVYSRYPFRANLEFDNPGQAVLLHTLFTVLGAEAHVVLPARDHEPGTMLVGHPAVLDPVALAVAVGIPQPDLDLDLEP